MGLFDRFKTDGTTKKGPTAKEWFDKGKALTRSDPNEALQCYDKALAIDPQDADVWSWKGATLGALERDREAFQCYDKALAIDPQNVGAQKSKAILLEMIRMKWTADEGAEMARTALRKAKR